MLRIRYVRHSLGRHESCKHLHAFLHLYSNMLTMFVGMDEDDVCRALWRCLAMPTSPVQCPEHGHKMLANHLLEITGRSKVLMAQSKDIMMIV